MMSSGYQHFTQMPSVIDLLQTITKLKNDGFSDCALEHGHIQFGLTPAELRKTAFTVPILPGTVRRKDRASNPPQKKALVGISISILFMSA